MLPLFYLLAVSPRDDAAAAMEAVRATAETLQATLEHMKVVEEMRRTLRKIRDENTRDSN
jgi:hypothetical protein